VENPKIFLSHSSKDQALAEKLANQIRNFLGFEDKAVFVSSEPEGIDIGTDWFNSVVDALEKSEVFVILITPNSMASNWVWFEIGYFWKKKKQAIYPLYTPPVNISHPLNTLEAKVLTDSRNLKVFFKKLAVRFQVSEFKLESNSLDSIVTLAIQDSQPAIIQMEEEDIKAKLVDYLKNEYKVGDAILYSELDNNLNLPAGSTKKYLKQTAFDKNYKIKNETDEWDTGIRLRRVEGGRIVRHRGLYPSQSSSKKSKPRS